MLGPIEHVLRLAGMEMELVTQTKQEFERHAYRAAIVQRQFAQQLQAVGVGGAEAGETDPAQKLHVAQSAA